MPDKVRSGFPPSLQRTSVISITASRSGALSAALWGQVSHSCLSNIAQLATSSGVVATCQITSLPHLRDLASRHYSVARSVGDVHRKRTDAALGGRRVASCNVRWPGWLKLKEHQWRGNPRWRNATAGYLHRQARQSGHRKFA